MDFNGINKEKAVHLLYAAAAQIKRAEEEFICIAVSRSAQEDLRGLGPTAYHIKEVIHHRLGPNCATLDSWLYVHHDISHDTPGYEKKIRRTRLRWINSLIQEVRAA